MAKSTETQSLSGKFLPIPGSEHTHETSPAVAAKSATGVTGEKLTATLILRRNPGGQPVKSLADFHATAFADRKPLARTDFISRHGAAGKDIQMVEAVAVAKGLTLKRTNQSARSIVLQGTAEQFNDFFAVKLQNYFSELGDYRGHEGPAHLPIEVNELVEAVIGLDNRKVPAIHLAGDPANTHSLTPQQVAGLYNFPVGDANGQTIGIFEMPTNEGNPGYSQKDIAATMAAFGGNLAVPKPVDVSVDGQKNTGISDGETLLDITIAAAIAQRSTIAVYFTAGQTNQDIIHCLQRMIHPTDEDPQPNVVSISYGWSPDEITKYISDVEFTQMSSLFQDAAHLGITVLASSGDSGAMFLSKTKAEVSYPATDPWVLSCGGTTIGNVKGSRFTEYVWNDTWDNDKGKGATGGGISGRFPVPVYQQALILPKGLNKSNFKGRGMPDIAGNASPVSGYLQDDEGQSTGGGGTSAVAPLYAGLIALLNKSLGTPVGYLNPQLYALADSCFNEVSAPPGPAGNSFGGVKGYPASKGWNACTGLGSINGRALLDVLNKTGSKSAAEIMKDHLATANV